MVSELLLLCITHRPPEGLLWPIAVRHKGRLRPKGLIALYGTMSYHTFIRLIFLKYTETHAWPSVESKTTHIHHDNYSGLGLL